MKKWVNTRGLNSGCFKNSNFIILRYRFTLRAVKIFLHSESDFLPS
ncbi:hypothetical protein Pan153_39320 [Gimesia panareensis]|uniref:Uncharacterized protein n=1 Tax=Gimesia panareensis TaxID=2527978 RepID=A0A518FSE8_9PLAN|nr:hypothetical protein Pan153_39320 [Gimesia panareensis]